MMPTCEKCWNDSGGNPRVYARLTEDRNLSHQVCTPEEQAGTDADICPVCKRKTLHQMAHVCMNPDCIAYCEVRSTEEERGGG